VDGETHGPCMHASRERESDAQQVRSRDDTSGVVVMDGKIVVFDRCSPHSLVRRRGQASSKHDLENAMRGLAPEATGLQDINIETSSQQGSLSRGSAGAGSAAQDRPTAGFIATSHVVGGSADHSKSKASGVKGKGRSFLDDW
jgi:hypothetical protein